MIHLGDITKINGAEIEPVDCITAGSPCQDLSVAGKRAGLEGERSGLFMEQIRIIKEMREHDRNNGRTDEFIRPRYMVWENVPGAFSSNKGEDFRCVLEETAKVAERDAVIPGPPKGKWSKSGAIMGDGWSIAWRVHDAQFWGVPQRRKRIALVADFGGESAPEILFERKSLSGDIAKSGKERQRAAKDAEGCVGETDATFKVIGFNRERCGAVAMDDMMPTLQAAAGESGNNQPMAALSFQERAGKPGGGKGILIQNERTGALSTLNNQSVVYGISAYESNAMKSGNPHSGIYEAETARTLDLNGGSPACNQGGMAVVYGFDPGASRDVGVLFLPETSKTLSNGSCPGHHNGVVYGFDWQEERNIGSDGWCMRECAKTITSTKPGATMVSNPCEVKCYSIDEKMGNTYVHEEQGNTLGARDYKQPQAVCKSYQKVTGTISPGAHAGSYNGQDAYNDMLISAPVVRRLTPLECERLQGFPDGWTDIGDWIDSKDKKHKGESDSPRYKALGNSIALPFWFYLLRRISAQYERPATLGSLFDGIGGFPLCWERCNGSGTARWASEIEEFPIAVTKHWFG